MSTPPGDDRDPFAPPSGDVESAESAESQRPPSSSPDQPGWWEQQASDGERPGSAHAPQWGAPPGGGPGAGDASGQGAGQDPVQQWGSGAQPAAGAGWGQQQPAWGQGQQWGPPAQQWGQPQQWGQWGTPPDHPRASTAMVMGIIGLVGGFLCGLPLLASPFAMVMGRRAVREIDASGGRIGGRGNAQAGFITGLIGTILLGLALVGIVLAIVLFAVTASQVTTY